MFQSSPIPKDGRYSMTASGIDTRRLFQSSPIPKDGRYLRERIPDGFGQPRFNPRPSRRMGATSVARDKLAKLLVSILAHPEGWALQYPVNPLIYRKFTIWFARAQVYLPLLERSLMAASS